MHQSTVDIRPATGAEGVAAMYIRHSDLPGGFQRSGTWRRYISTRRGIACARLTCGSHHESLPADGVDTTFFHRRGDDPDGDGFPNFFGTQRLLRRMPPPLRAWSFSRPVVRGVCHLSRVYMKVGADGDSSPADTRALGCWHQFQGRCSSISTRIGPDGAGISV